MHEHPTPPAELGLRLIDFQRQVDELAEQLAAELAAMSDPDQELSEITGEVA